LIWRSVVLVATALLTSDSTLAQSTPSLDQLLDRMGTYLTSYERDISTVVADERFEQKYYGGGVPVAVLLESEVAFMRLPGDAEWLGFRDVKKSNYKPVRLPGPTIAELLTLPAPDMTKAVAIANAGAVHNLGLVRTINTPTTPLHIIHPRNRPAHRFELDGEESVRGRRTTVIGFVETRRPALLREPNGESLVSSGRIWVEARTGVVWRVQWNYDRESSRGRPPHVRVEFEPHAELQMMVPRELRESFYLARTGRGEGRATYRNFRRFGTSARIVPQSR
jgi:hypothetical protein